MKKSPLFVIFLTVFIDLMGFGIIIPLSPYLARHYGASALEVGLLMAVYSFMQFLFSPWWGQLSDKMGRRPVLLVSIAGTAVAHLFFFLAPNLLCLFVARTLAGVFSANISTANAFIADVTDEKDRSKSMGLIGAAFGLGFVLGPAIGGLFTFVSDNFPAAIAAILSGVNFLMAYFILPETLKPNRPSMRSSRSRVRRILDRLATPTVGTLLAIHFLIGLAMANMEATLFLFVQDKFDWGVRLASFGFAYVGIWIAFTQGYLVRKILPRVGERKLIFIGLFLFSTGMLLIGASTSVYHLAVAMTALALGNGFVNPSLIGGLSVLSSSNEQGEIMGVAHSLAALARILGPPVGGFIYGHWAMQSPFFLAACLALLGILLGGRIWAQIPSAAKQ